MMKLTYHMHYNVRCGKYLHIPDQYAEYYHKGIVESMHAGYKTIQYKLKPNSIIDYVSLIESTNPKPVADPHMSFLWCLNSKYSTLRYIREHEKRAFYLDEAQVETIPTKDLQTKLKSVLINNFMPNDIVNATFGQTGNVKLGDELYDTKLVDFIMTNDDPTMKIVPMFSLWLPLYEKDSTSNSIICKSLEDVIQRSGYEISDVNVWSVGKQPFDKPICIMAFSIEARYNDIEVNLTDTMFHVTTFAALDAIRRDGLLPKSQSKQFKYPDRVYLFNGKYLENAEGYGCKKVIDAQVKDMKFCILQIDGKKLRESPEYKNADITFYADGAFDNSATTDKAVFTYEAIPKKFIKQHVMIYEVNEVGDVKMKIDEHGEIVPDVKIINF